MPKGARGGISSYDMGAADARPKRTFRPRAAKPTPPARGLGRSLDELRSHMGLSVPQLASRLGWTPGLLAALIAGKITPSKGQHADLAKLARDYRKEKEDEENGVQHSADRE